MMNIVFSHYGIDWVALVLTFTAIWKLGDKSRAGFVIMMLGNACWVGLAVMVSSVAMAVANVVFLSVNLRGYLKWTPSPRTSPSTTE